MAPGLQFRVGVTSKRRTQERFHATTALTESWTVESDLDNYGADIEPMLAAVDNYCIAQRSGGLTVVTVHYAISLDNVTAAAPGAGSWVAAKGHFDGALTHEEMLDIDKLRTTLLNCVTDLRTKAKY